MNFGLNRYYDTLRFNYVNDIISQIHRSIIDAANKNNIEAFNELIDFMQFTLLAKSFDKSLNDYSKITTTLIYIYPHLNGQFKTIFLERIFESLFMRISFTEKDDNVDSKYIELSYLPLINITKLILQNDDYDAFNYAYKKIQESIFTIDYYKDYSGYFFKYITTLLSWIYFLRFNNSINYSQYQLDYFEQNFENITIDFNKTFLNIYFNLFEEIEDGLWAVNNWEIKEPPKNVAYFPLTPNSWIPFSLTIILLKYNHLINAGDDLTKINLIPQFKYFFDDIKKVLDNITADKIEYTKLLFNHVDEKEYEQQLNYRKEKILNVFAYLKKEIEIQNYKRIREVPLSESKISEFRNNVGELWEKNLVVVEILKHFGKVNYFPNKEEIKGYGFFRTFVKMRFAFIDGTYYQHVFGLSDFGARLARDIDNQFFVKLLELKAPETPENISVTIDQFIDTLKGKKDYVVIFANWKAEQKLENVVYHQENKVPFSFKSYNNIPVINSYNHFKDLIFVVDFSNIDINIYTSENVAWYKNQLFVDVTEYQKGEITEDTMKEWNEKEGYNYNEEEIDVLESNNVNIKILFKSEYKMDKDNINFLIIKGK